MASVTCGCVVNVNERVTFIFVGWWIVGFKD